MQFLTMKIKFIYSNFSNSMTRERTRIDAVSLRYTPSISAEGEHSASSSPTLLFTKEFSPHSTIDCGGRQKAIWDGQSES